MPRAGEGATGEGEFKEADGTGLGDGQGAKDVSDQIEEQDQLTGALQAGAEAQPPPEPEQVRPARRRACGPSARCCSLPEAAVSRGPLACASRIGRVRRYCLKTRLQTRFLSSLRGRKRAVRRVLLAAQGVTCGRRPSRRCCLGTAEVQAAISRKRFSYSGGNRAVRRVQGALPEEKEEPRGVEMDGDFDGELFDVPEKGADEDDDSGGDDGGEELQREMGDDAGDGQEVTGCLVIIYS